MGPAEPTAHRWPLLVVVGLPAAIIFLAALDIGLVAWVTTDERYQSVALIQVEESPSFSITRTPRSLVGLVRDTDDPSDDRGLVEPIEGTPLARVIGRGATPAEAEAEADRRAQVAVDGLNRLSSDGFRTQLVTPASPARPASTRPLRVELAVIAIMVTGSLTTAGLAARSMWRGARQAPVASVRAR